MEDCTINVMMFGGRRCGKTSVITAMHQNFGTVFGADSDIVISAEDYDTMTAIQEKGQEIKRFFLYRSHGEFSTDGVPTEGDAEYRFELSLKGKSTGHDHITLSLYDFPGEWLVSGGKEKDDLLKERMKHSSIIMIAIDTPYLMEPLPDVLKSENRVGNWNDERNYCWHITNKIKKYFTPSDGDNPKMILFVPLKCEKYYNNGQIWVVNSKIKTAYKDLLNFTNTGANKEYYELVIAPILTFGKHTVAFSRFGTDANGELIMGSSKYPTKQMFIFDDRGCSYSPQFCEQPLLYALAYLLARMNEIKKRKKGLFGFLRHLPQAFGEMFGNWASAEDFLTQSEKIKMKLKSNSDGYEILSDPLKLEW